MVIYVQIHTDRLKSYGNKRGGVHDTMLLNASNYFTFANSNTAIRGGIHDTRHVYENNFQFFFLTVTELLVLVYMISSGHGNSIVSNKDVYREVNVQRNTNLYQLSPAADS